MAEPYWLTGKLSTDAEFRRLEQLASQYNHAVKIRTQQLGLGPGSRVLEIGPGLGILPGGVRLAHADLTRAAGHHSRCLERSRYNRAPANNRP